MIEELRPIVERARNTETIMSVNNNTNVTLASLLGASHQPAVTAPRDTNSGNVTINSGILVIFWKISVLKHLYVINSKYFAEEVVIDMDGSSTSVTVVAQNGTTQGNNSPSPTQSADTVNTNNNSANSNNGSGDERKN